MQDNNATGPVSLSITGIWAVISWISLQNAQTLLTLLATTITICAGMLSCRYYWYAAQEKKRSLKNPQS